MTKRPDRSGDQGFTPGGLASLACQLGAAAVQSPGQLLQPVFGQTEAVGAEGIRLDRIGACFNVLAVDRRDDLRLGQHEFVEAGSLGNPARVEERAHRAVEQERPAPEQEAEPLALGQGSRSGRPGART